jgi:hypothetical protein
MTIIKNIINSAKKTWRGEEDPVKVFYTWGLACYIILPLLTAGLGYLSLILLDNLTSALSFILLFFVPPVIFVFIAPLLTYILYSRNIANVRAKNIKVKKRIVRGLLLDIPSMLSILLFLLTISENIFPDIVVLIFFLPINLYRYYRYNVKYRLIFNEKLLNYKVPTLYLSIKSFVTKVIKKRFYNYNPNQIIEDNNSKEPNIDNVKIITSKAFYLSIFIAKIILDILYLPFFTLGVVTKIIFIPIIAVFKEFSKLAIPVLLATIILFQLNQNQFNRFKQGFYFEKYSTAKEANNALLQLHPIGSDVNALVKTLEKAGGKVKEESLESYYEYKKFKKREKWWKKDVAMILDIKYDKASPFFVIINWIKWGGSIQADRNKSILFIGLYKSRAY